MKYFVVLSLALVTFSLTHVNAARPTSSLCKSTCDSACAKCTSKIVDGDNYIITVDLSTCKGNGETVGWMCCRTPGCDTLSCDAARQVDQRCEQARTASFIVPLASTSITIQTFDNKQLGNVNCAVTGSCCGSNTLGCDGSSSGVCNQEIFLDTCESDFARRGNMQCIDDSDCGARNDKSCSRSVCENGKCVAQVKPKHAMCRPAIGDCDVPEYCTGNSPNCPPDKQKNTRYVCREYEDMCDVAERCVNNSLMCPPDMKIPNCFTP